MTRSVFMAVSAAAGILWGVLGLAAPGPLQTFYGISPNTTTTAMVQLLAASYLGYALLNWIAKDVRDAAAQRAIGVGNFAAWAISLLVAVLTVPNVSTNIAGYSAILLQTIFAVAWAYYAFVERRTVAQPAH